MKPILLVAVLFSGCVQVGPKNFPVAPPASAKPVVCAPAPKLAMPGIPEVVTMKIRGDVVEQCDPGCEQVIRQYAAAQKLLR